MATAEAYNGFAKEFYRVRKNDTYTSSPSNPLMEPDLGQLYSNPSLTKLPQVTNRVALSSTSANAVKRLNHRPIDSNIFPMDSPFTTKDPYQRENARYGNTFDRDHRDKMSSSTLNQNNGSSMQNLNKGMTQSAIIKPIKKVNFEEEFSSTSLAGKNLMKGSGNQNGALLNSQAKNEENRALYAESVAEDKMRRMREIEELLLMRNAKTEENEEDQYEEMGKNREYMTSKHISNESQLKPYKNDEEPEEYVQGSSYDDVLLRREKQKLLERERELRDSNIRKIDDGDNKNIPVYKGAAYYNYENKNLVDSLNSILNLEKAKTQNDVESEVYNTKKQPIKVNKVNHSENGLQLGDIPEKFSNLDQLKKQYRYFKRGVAQDSNQSDLIKEKEQSIRELENRGLSLQMSRVGKNLIEYKSALQRRLMMQMDKERKNKLRSLLKEEKYL